MSPERQKPIAIGLTGGIGSGKSLAGKYFVELGVPLIDADIVARQVVAKGQPALQRLAEHFGSEIINDSEELKRHLLREIIFNDDSARAWVENLLHPLIKEKIAHWINQQKAPYCIVVIPLLLEKEQYPFLDRVLVIDAPEASQLARVQARDNAEKKDVQKIINTQLARKDRLAKADDILLNDNSKQALKEKIIKLNDYYQQQYQQ